jgi:hypothetical protein
LAILRSASATLCPTRSTRKDIHKACRARLDEGSPPSGHADVRPLALDFDNRRGDERPLTHHKLHIAPDLDAIDQTLLGGSLAAGKWARDRGPVEIAQSAFLAVLVTR